MYRRAITILREHFLHAGLRLRRRGKRIRRNVTRGVGWKNWGRLFSHTPEQNLLFLMDLLRCWEPEEVWEDAGESLLLESELPALTALDWERLIRWSLLSLLCLLHDCTSCRFLMLFPRWISPLRLVSTDLLEALTTPLDLSEDATDRVLRLSGTDAFSR